MRVKRLPAATIKGMLTILERGRARASQTIKEGQEDLLEEKKKRTKGGGAGIKRLRDNGADGAGGQRERSFVACAQWGSGQSDNRCLEPT